MRLRRLWLFAAVTLVGCSAAKPVPLGQTFEGKASYYDSDGRGACGYDATADDYAAISATLWANSAACGTCIEVTGAKATFVVRVVDRCPECGAEHLDLRPSSFQKLAALSEGQTPIRWKTVTCPTVGNLRLQLKDGSNPWWVAVQVRNHRRPVATLEAKVSGTWKSLPRADYNYFVDESGIGEGPVELRVTADDGTQVLATVPKVQSGIELEASGQF